MDQLGYDVTWQVCNSKDFGVPQSRKRVYIIGYNREKCSGQVLSFSKTNAKTAIQRLPGKEGERIYSVNGASVTLTSSGGGFGGQSGLYYLENQLNEIFDECNELKIISKNKQGYQIACPGDSIDIGYAGKNSRRGRVGNKVAHTLTTSSTQAYYFIDMNPNSKITEVARCLTARYDSGISNRQSEHSGILVDGMDESKMIELFNEDSPFILVFRDKNDEVHIGRVRKLTPKECWRLQGFTDEQFDNARKSGLSDSRLYKMAGNAVTVPVISAIGKLILEVDKLN